MGLLPFKVFALKELILVMCGGRFNWYNLLGGALVQYLLRRVMRTSFFNVNINTAAKLI